MILIQCYYLVSIKTFAQHLTSLVLEQKVNPTAKMSKLKKDQNITTNLETKKKKPALQFSTNKQV